MENENNKNFEVHSQAIRAGKRTYFFDVKKTRGDDLYLTITESKKRFNPDGKPSFEKHKLFLYKEDFDKFEEGLQNALDKIQELKESGEFPILENENGHNKNHEYSDVTFDDLGE